MGKSSRNKRARTGDGMVFSRIDPVLFAMVRTMHRVHGDLPFHYDKHPVWGEMYEAWRKMDRTPEENNTYPVILHNSLAILHQRKWRTIYVASAAVVDFIEHSDFKESDTELLELVVKRIYEDVGSTGLVIHYAGKRLSAVLHRMSVDGEPYTGFYLDEAYGALPRNDIGEWQREYGYLYRSAKDMLNMIINLYLYMEVFPECVSNAPPHIVGGDRSEGVTRTIGTSTPIESVYRQAQVSPHMRRGHFRVLKSERYTHKKGQAVYVKPTMVRGAVRTVTEA